MSNNNDYIITTLDSGSQEYTNLCGNQIRAPFSLAAPSAQTLRLTGAPYVVSQNDKTLFSRTLIPADSDGYYTPWMYLKFETSSSTTVSGIQGQQSAYTGTITATDTPPYSAGEFGYFNTYVFQGDYAFRFPDDFNEHYIEMGTPATRTEWSSLFSGSFSLSAWVYLEQTSGNSTVYNGTPIFGLGPMSTYGFSFNIDRNALGSGVVSYYSYGPDGTGVNPNGVIRSWTGATGILNYQGWNHIVFVVDGATTATNRRVKAYVNNNDIGYIDDTTANQYFQKSWTTTKSVFFGNYKLNQGNYALDETSLWDFALTSAQVNLLYNSASPIDNLTALPSGSC